MTMNHYESSNYKVDLMKFTSIVFLLVSMLFVANCSEKVAGKIGENVEIKLTYNDGGFRKSVRASTKALLRVTEVELLKAPNDISILRIYLDYTNFGKSEIDFPYSFACIKDSQGRVYTGQNETDFEEAIYKSQAPYGLYISSKPFDLIKCGPGIKCSNYVAFEVPTSILREDIYFGFVSSINKNKFQGNILIRDSGTSKSQYESFETFTTPNWH
jgi:hypothetical protein